MGAEGTQTTTPMSHPGTILNSNISGFGISPKSGNFQWKQPLTSSVNNTNQPMALGSDMGTKNLSDMPRLTQEDGHLGHLRFNSPSGTLTKSCFFLGYCWEVEISDR